MRSDPFPHDIADYDEPLVRTDWRDYSHPTVAIVETTATATGRDPADVEKLQTYVDCDALDTVLTGSTDSLALSFTYDGVLVNIAADGRLEIWSS